MSVEALALALHHSQTRGNTKLVLLGIANHDGDGGSWPSIATLAKYARIEERSVRRCLAELERLGEISIAINAGGTHRTRNDQRPNLFHILLKCPEWCDGSREHRDTREHDGRTVASSRRGSGGTVEAKRGDSGGRNGRTVASSEPSIEPSRTGGARPDRCSRHQTVEDPPGCWSCKERRENYEAQIVADKKERERARRKERQRMERAQREKELAEASTPEAQEARERAMAEVKASLRRRS